MDTKKGPLLSPQDFDLIPTRGHAHSDWYHVLKNADGEEIGTVVPAVKGPIASPRPIFDQGGQQLTKYGTFWEPRGWTWTEKLWYSKFRIWLYRVCCFYNRMRGDAEKRVYVPRWADRAAERILHGKQRKK